MPTSTAAATTDFAQWLDKTAGTPPTAEVLQEGIALAQARQAQMQQLIRRDPEAALAEAISLQDYAQLPDAIKPYVEKPFSTQASLMVLPDETGLMQPDQRPRFDPNQRVQGNKTYLHFADGSQTEVVLHGSRTKLPSKDGMAVQGIMLDGVSAIHPAALQIVSADEATFIEKNFAARTTDTQHDFYTGEVIQDKPVLALAGGQVFHFASATNVETLNAKLAELETHTDPKAGSQLLFAGQAQPGTGAESMTTTPLATQINQQLAAGADSWSTTPKKVYFIRTQFPDISLKTSQTKAKLMSDLQKVSDNVREMSHGKTYFSTIDVNEEAVVLDGNSTVYYQYETTVDAQGKTNTSMTLNKDSQAASEAIAKLKLIDPTFNENNYDMIGFFFPDVTGGAPGWAGGSRLWIFDYDNEYLLTHEFGHCYGLGHAHFWEPTTASSVGAGNHIEYGDSFDFMGGTYDNRDDYHIQGLVKLGWLETANWQDITASGAYRINRFDHASATGNRALRISRGAGGGYYWLGHRQKFDDNPTLENGAYLIWQKNGFERSWQVDTTPGSVSNAQSSSADRRDGGIIVGRTYSDKTVTPNIHITTLAKGGTEPNQWLDIQVNLGAFAGNNAPILSGINGATNAQARTNITFSAMATDADSDTLAYQWDFGDGLINANAETITHQWAVGGTYTVKLTVSDMKGGTASTQIAVTVADPLNVWTQRTSGTTKNLHDIATDGNKVIAVSHNQMGYVLSSPDGQTWTPSTAFDSGRHMDGIHYANGLWVAVGLDWSWTPSGWFGAIFTSTDGNTWTRRYHSGSQLLKVTYGNGIWVAVGENGTVVKSTDGITWVQQNSNTLETLTDIAYGNGKFVAVAAGNPLLLLTSTDGVTWEDHSSETGINSGNEYSRIDYLLDRFVASGWYEGISYSTDGTHFQNNQPRGHFAPAHAYGSGLFFAAGINRSDSNVDMNFVSTDGMTWSPLSTVSQPNRNAAIFFKNTFITVGQEGSIYQSAPLTTDTTPDAFSFTAQTDVPVSAVIISAPAKITGIDVATTWTATNGYACVSSGNNCNCDVVGFAASGAVSNGQYLCAQHTSSANYATSVASTVSVGGVSSSFGSTTVKNTQTINFGALGNKTLGNADFAISASASSGLAVSFSSQTPSVCSVAGTSVHLVAAGTCTIRASQAGNATYSAAVDVDQSFTVSAISVINGSCGTDHGATLTAIPTNLCAAGNASAITTGTSSYTWSCGGINGGSPASCLATRHYKVFATVNGSGGSISPSQAVAYQAKPSFTLTPEAGYLLYTMTGECGGALKGNVFTTKPITADCSVVAHFMAKTAQTITFASLSTKLLGSADFTLSATSSSGLAVSFSSQTPSVCSVTGKTVHLVAVGTCTIRASQSGDAAYAVATAVDQSFTVSPPAAKLLKLTVSRTGLGSITSTPAGINCGRDCSESYAQNTVVTLNATPTAGNKFIGWTGANCSNTSCDVTMDVAKKVTANFVKTYVLTVKNAGNGKVTGLPTGIECGADCTEIYTSGTNITLTATPDANRRFTGWSGACRSTTSTCTVRMTAAKTVTATFKPLFTLTVSKIGTGSGTITTSPTGVSCGTDCTEDYVSDTRIKLTAKAATGSRFFGWSGACVGKASTCSVTMTAVKEVTANFIPK
ncbi:MAG: hypothetical protein BWK73_35835 [Thiothrix lacustris]|uniref:PKD domain-containing protein n=1 Tax=Thiothrix lacustris TaxID=525917 RepID=A0A1Y1QFS3_9GAMM|nr:MAG: hypothetical protein BWK73_35835 [Thiothrix lacustris]